MYELAIQNTSSIVLELGNISILLPPSIEELCMYLYAISNCIDFYIAINFRVCSYGLVTSPPVRHPPAGSSTKESSQICHELL